MSFTYELDCNTFKVIQFVLDLSASENIVSEVDPEKGLKFDITVQPFTKALICCVILKDGGRKASIKTKKSWRISEPPDEMIKEFVEQHEADLEKFLQVAMELELNDDSASAEQLTERCLANDVLFLDADFPPNDTSLYKSATGEITRVGPRAFWRRPRLVFFSFV